MCPVDLLSWQPQRNTFDLPLPTVWSSSFVDPEVQPRLSGNVRAVEISLEPPKTTRRVIMATRINNMSDI